METSISEETKGDLKEWEQVLKDDILFRGRNYRLEGGAWRECCQPACSSSVQDDN